MRLDNPYIIVFKMADHFQPAPIQLTRKQRLFLREYIQSGDPGSAALISGMVRKNTHPHDASIAGAELLRELQPQLVTMMDAYGLSDRAILRGVLEGIGATVKKILTIQEKDANGNPLPKRFEVVDTGAPNWGVRKFYHRLASEMKSLVDPRERTAIEQANVARVTSIHMQHRESLAGKSDAELAEIQRQEALKRQGRVRRAVS